MSGFCKLNTTADHTNDWNTPYPSSPSIVTGLSGTSFTRDMNGLIQDSDIPGIITKLQTQGIIPAVPTQSNTSSSDLETFLKKDMELVDGIKAEYCYYNERYVWAINQLFGSLIGPSGQGYTSVSTASQATIQKYLGASVQLNQKLNDITKVCKGISASRASSIQGLGTRVNQLNAQLDKTSASLTSQQKILTSGKDNTILYKEMERYSQQKNRYSNNMLMLYSFLNITALGLLFYVYRSSSSE